VTLYFFELITETEFVGPIVVAAGTEDDAWNELARRESAAVSQVRERGWQIAQELERLPARPGVVYPGYYRQAIR
jgi:hypothetical protein